MNINGSASCYLLDHPEKKMKFTASESCNSGSGQVATKPLLKGQNGQPSSWNNVISEMVVNIMSYLPFNEVVKCYTLDKRTCTIIRNFILKPKMGKIRPPREIYSKEYYKDEIRPWFISLKQDALVHHLDFAIHGDNFHQLLCLFISEIFQSAQRIDVSARPVFKNCKWFSFNCNGSVALIEGKYGGVSILSCHRSKDWSEILNLNYQIKITLGDSAFSADGTKLALCDDDGNLIILSFGRDESGMLKIRKDDRFHYKQRVRRPQFTPDGLDLLFTVFNPDSWWNRTRFMILSLNPQEKWVLTEELRFPVATICSPKFSPDGSCFVIVSIDGTIKFFTNSAHRQVAPLWSYRGVLDYLNNAFSSPPCRWVQQPGESSLRGMFPCFSPDGINVEFFATPSNQHFMVKQVQGCWVKQQDFDKRLGSFSYSPDGKTMAAILRIKDRYDALCIFVRNSAGDWVKSHRYLYDLPEANEAEANKSILSLAFTEDSESLWVCYRPGVIDIRQKVEGEWQVVHRVDNLPKFTHVKKSNDGKTLAIDGKSGIFSVMFNNGRFWEEHLSIEARNVNCCFSLDNQWMAVVTGAGYGRIMAWQNKRWVFRTDWFLACPQGVNLITFCPNNVAIVINHQLDFSPEHGSRHESVHIFNLIPAMA